jgi:hypothetical protein
MGLTLDEQWAFVNQHRSFDPSQGKHNAWI